MLAISGIGDAVQTLLIELLLAASAESKRRPGDGVADAKLRASNLSTVRVTLGAARRYRGYESAIARLLHEGMQAADRLGIHVEAIELAGEAGGLRIDLHVGPMQPRAGLWNRLAEINWALPFAVSFTLS